jgi:seryl-tRNA synthetase
MNDNCIAMGRTIIAILENYQNEDGSLISPKFFKSGWVKKNRTQRVNTAGDIIQ